MTFAKKIIDLFYLIQPYTYIYYIIIAIVVIIIDFFSYLCAIVCVSNVMAMRHDCVDVVL